MQNEISNANKVQLESEFGDLLFSIVNAARLFNIEPESALEKTNKKFISRFNYIEKSAKQSDTSIKDMSLERMDTLWEEAKKTE